MREKMSNQDRNKNISESALVINSKLSDSVKVYKDARVKECTMGNSSSVGDHTKMDFSRVEDYVRIDRFNHLFHAKLGRHSYTGQNTVIMHADIGRFCSISWGVTIGPANHSYDRISTHSFVYNAVDGLRPDNKEEAYNRFTTKCTIGNDVWIGTGATILRDVEIGNGAIVGAGAVVTKDVPPYAIVTGIPAKIIKYRFPEEIIEKLLELKWWNWDDETIRENYEYFAEKVSLERLCELEKRIR